MGCGASAQKNGPQGSGPSPPSALTTPAVDEKDQVNHEDFRKITNGPSRGCDDRSHGGDRASMQISARGLSSRAVSSRILHAILRAYIPPKERATDYALRRKGQVDPTLAEFIAAVLMPSVQGNMSFVEGLLNDSLTLPKSAKGKEVTAEHLKSGGRDHGTGNRFRSDDEDADAPLTGEATVVVITQPQLCAATWFEHIVDYDRAQEETNVSWQKQEKKAPHFYLLEPLAAASGDPSHRRAFLKALAAASCVLLPSLMPTRDSEVGGHAYESGLHYAATWGDEELVRDLIDLGADPSMTDARERTPLEVAIQHGHAGAASMLAAAKGRGENAKNGEELQGWEDRLRASQSALPLVEQGLQPWVFLRLREAWNKLRTDVGGVEAQWVRAFSRPGRRSFVSALAGGMLPTAGVYKLAKTKVEKKPKKKGRKEGSWDFDDDYNDEYADDYDPYDPAGTKIKDFNIELTEIPGDEYGDPKEQKEAKKEWPPPIGAMDVYVAASPECPSKFLMCGVALYCGVANDRGTIPLEDIPDRSKKYFLIPSLAVNLHASPTGTVDGAPAAAQEELAATRATATQGLIVIPEEVPTREAFAKDTSMLFYMPLEIAAQPKWKVVSASTTYKDEFGFSGFDETPNLMLFSHPLLWAIEHGREDIVAALLHAKADPNVEAPPPLPSTDLLFSYEINGIRGADERPQSALERCARTGRQAIAAMLQDAGAKTTPETEEIEEEFRTSLADRGVSTRFLMRMAQRQGVKEYMDTIAPGQTMHLDTHAWASKSTTADVVFGLIKPMTGIALCDWVEAHLRGTVTTFARYHHGEKFNEDDERNEIPWTKLVGPSTFFVSHSWGTSFTDLVKAIRNYDTGLPDDKSERFYWLDILAVNQHFAGDFAESPDSKFEDVIQAAERGVLLYLGPWKSPVALTRVWCLYEVWTATKLEIPITAIFEDDFWAHCLQTADVDTYEQLVSTQTEILSKIDLQNAEATVASDRDYIFSQVRESQTPFDVVNETVRRAVEMAQAPGRLVAAIAAGAFDQAKGIIEGARAHRPVLIPQPGFPVLGLCIARGRIDCVRYLLENDLIDVNARLEAPRRDEGDEGGLLDGQTALSLVVDLICLRDAPEHSDLGGFGGLGASRPKFHEGHYGVQAGPSHNSSKGVYQQLSFLRARAQAAAGADLRPVWREMFHLLIEHGADVNYYEDDHNQFLKRHKRSKCPVLYTAVVHDDLPLVKALLDANADPNLQLGSGVGASDDDPDAIDARGRRRTISLRDAGPLHMAQSVDAVEMLLAAGARVEAVEDWGGASPVHSAAANKRPKVLEALVAAGADVNQFTTPHSAKYAYDGCVEPPIFCVFSENTSYTFITPFTEMPGHEAALQTLEVLRSNGADLSKHREGRGKGDSLIEVVAAWDTTDDGEIVRWVLEHTALPCDPDERVAFLRSALLCNMENDRTRDGDRDAYEAQGAFDALLEAAGADVMKAPTPKNDESGSSTAPSKLPLLIHALQRVDLKMGKLKPLVTAAATAGVINATEQYGRSALHHVVHRWGAEEAIKVLVEARADVNVRDGLGKSPFNAAEHGNGEVLEALVGDALDKSEPKAPETPKYDWMDSAAESGSLDLFS